MCMVVVGYWRVGRRRETHSGWEGKKRNMVLDHIFFARRHSLCPEERMCMSTDCVQTPESPPPLVCPFIHHTDLSVLTLENSDFGWWRQVLIHILNRQSAVLRRNGLRSQYIKCHKKLCCNECVYLWAQNKLAANWELLNLVLCIFS